MTVIADQSSSGAAIWSTPFGRGVITGYTAGATASDDFSTCLFARFREKSVELSLHDMLRTSVEAFWGNVPTLPQVRTTMKFARPADHPELSRAESRLSFLAELDVAKSFEEIEPLSAATLRESGALLRKLAALGPQCTLPTLGMDTDGTVVFSYLTSENRLVGSMSVFGDGTYSYCIERDGKSVQSGASLIAGPLDKNLMQLLLGQ